MDRSISPTTEHSVGLVPCEHLTGLKNEHVKWLSQFDPQYLRNFEKLCNSDYEGAMTEAAVRREMQRHGQLVEPAEDLTGSSKSVDFLCTSPDGFKFFVEATCVSVQKTAVVTGLPHPPEPGARNYCSLNDALWAACKGKTVQCGGLPHPTLVAVGTHHTTASMNCVQKPHIEMLATGETFVSWSINTETGKSGGSTIATDFYSSSFLRRDETTEVGFARSSISGVLVFGFGVEQPNTLGVLHPAPARGFDRNQLPNIPFCEVEIDKQQGTVKTQWNGGESN